MNFKYLLFDLDGTLTEPFEGITKSVSYALASCGIEENDLENLKKFIGPPLVDAFMEYYGFDETKAKYALEKYRERFSRVGWMENKVYPGIPELLSDLKNDGRILVIATSKPEFFTQNIINHFDLTKYFDSVVGATMDEKRNTKAEIIKEIFDRFKLYGKENEVIMIGDRKHDIFGAKAFNIKSAGVRWGYADDGELEAAGADYIFNNIDELRNFLFSKKF